MGKFKVEVIGHVDVDSGTLMIGDPCYFIGDEWNEDHYSEFGDRMFEYDTTTGKSKDLPSVPLMHGLGHAGKGVVFGTTWGDGGYPVIGIWNTESDDPEFPYVSNRPSQVFVDMNPDYDEETDEYKFPAWLNV